MSLSVAREYEHGVIIIPTLFLLVTLVTLAALCFLRHRPEPRQPRIAGPQRYHSSAHRHTHKHSYRGHLQGIDGELPSVVMVTQPSNKL